MRLAARDVSVVLGGRGVVADASLRVDPGEVVGLLGPNGAGKSSLMRALAGLLPHRGSVQLDDRPIGSLTRAERASAVAYMPQARIIAWPLSVRDLVGLGRLPWHSFAAGPSDADREAVATAMELADVAHLADRPATDLSGGEQARVLAARAIAQSTPILIADEPGSGLDPAHQMTMMRALRGRAATGVGVLVSLHDLTLAARWCDRLVLMRDGRVVASGAPAEVLTAEMLETVFGIVAHIGRDECGMVLAPLGLAGGTR